MSEEEKYDNVRKVIEEAIALDKGATWPQGVTFMMNDSFLKTFKMSHVIPGHYGEAYVILNPTCGSVCGDCPISKGGEKMRLSQIIAVWDELHVKDVGELGYCDLEKALMNADVEIVNDLPCTPPDGSTKAQLV